MREIWFWQTVVSPHVSGLARALSRMGCSVRFVAGQGMCADRKALGWSVPPLDGVKLDIAGDRREIEALLAEAGRDSVHFCQGIRGNGMVQLAQSLLAARGLRQWVLMEAVDDAGPAGTMKRVGYAAMFLWHASRTEGVLALGHQTSDWVLARGVPAARVFPFAYFLEERQPPAARSARPREPFRVAYVGQFIERKRFPLLVNALAGQNAAAFELVVVGSGPLESTWRDYAEERLPGRVRWVGLLASEAVVDLLGEVDCLVLPSRHDGWGAVVSESLMRGTPAICSDRCGVAGAVTASGLGGVFRHDDVDALAALLARVIAAGPLAEADRALLSRWARSLGSEAGASYLLQILAHVEEGAARPRAPWTEAHAKCAA